MRDLIDIASGGAMKRPHVIIETTQELFNERVGFLEEGHTKYIGKIPVRKDKPDFVGDEYHAHVDLPGGYQASWGTSGKRRHSRRFPPADVSKEVRGAVAQVLNVHPDILECWEITGDNGESMLLVEVNSVKQLNHTLSQIEEV